MAFSMKVCGFRGVVCGRVLRQVVAGSFTWKGDMVVGGCVNVGKRKKGGRGGRIGLEVIEFGFCGVERDVM